MRLTPSQLMHSSFSDLDEAPAETIALLVAQIIYEASPASLRTFTSLLLDRTLRLVRQGARDEILDEALAVSSGISGDLGQALLRRSRETFGAWALLDQMLAEAGRRSDRAAVPSILLGSRGRGQAILEFLVGREQPVPRSRIREELKLAEAQLSHLLRDLEEADLIVRFRPERGGREVLVALGPVGRELAAKEMLPVWIERLAALLQRVAAGDLPDHVAMARELAEAGAPSRLAAERLATGLTQAAAAVVERDATGAVPSEIPIERRRKQIQYIEQLEAKDPHYEYTRSLAQPPRTQWAS